MRADANYYSNFLRTDYVKYVLEQAFGRVGQFVNQSLWNVGGHTLIDDVNGYLTNTCPLQNVPYRWIGGTYNKIKRGELESTTLKFQKTSTTSAQNKGFKPQKAIAMHFGVDQIKKLNARDWPHIRDLCFYKLEKGCCEGRTGLPRTTQDKYEWNGDGLEMYNYYKQFCTCKKLCFVRYSDESKDIITGETDFTFTYSVCPLNTVMALLGRHLQTSQYPEPRVVSEFVELTDIFISKLAEKILGHHKHDYPFEKHVEHYTGEKKTKVIQGYMSLLLCKPIDKVLHCFVKTGEWQRTERYLAMLKHYAGRARQIWGPSETLKALAGWFNRMVLLEVKHFVPAVACGYSTEQLAAKITHERNKKAAVYGWDKIKVLVYDGSSHDSHQNYQLIQAVDVNLFSRIFRKLLAPYGIFEDMLQAMYEAITDDWFTAYADCNLDGRRAMVYSLKILGTVFSGHPTRTTLGNSLRTLSYVCFLVYQVCGLDESVKVFFGLSLLITVYVCGDDVMIDGLDTIVFQLKIQVEKYYSKSTDQGVYGLGQTAKGNEIVVRDFDYVDFVSRQGYFDGIQFYICRKADRVYTNGNLTHKVMWNEGSARIRNTIRQVCGALNYAFVM